MPRAAINLEVDQIKEVVGQLDPKEKINLVKDLEESTWGDRFRGLLARIDVRVKENPVSEEEITEEVERVRKERNSTSSFNPRPE